MTEYWTRKAAAAA